MGFQDFVLYVCFSMALLLKLYPVRSRRTRRLSGLGVCVTVSRRYAYGTAFWSIKALIGTRRQIQGEPKASACIGDKHFIVRPPTCLTDNYNN